MRDRHAALEKRLDRLDDLLAYGVAGQTTSCQRKP
jgi:hypothetical protein